jgi:hypothetical protein
MIAIEKAGIRMERHKRLPGTWQAREKYLVLMKERKASKLSLMTFDYYSTC